MIAYNVIFIKDSEGKRLNESRSELDEKHLLLPFPSLERLPGEPEICASWCQMRLGEPWCKSVHLLPGHSSAFLSPVGVDRGKPFELVNRQCKK